jgi:hypothetical protein
MTEKKMTFEQFNHKFFDGWRKIKRVVPKFEKWYSMEDEDGKESWDEIKSIEIEFENGDKIIIEPFANKEDDEELCLGLKIYKQIAEEINWRIK